MRIVKQIEAVAEWAKKRPKTVRQLRGSVIFEMMHGFAHGASKKGRRKDRQRLTSFNV